MWYHEHREKFVFDDDAGLFFIRYPRLEFDFLLVGTHHEEIESIHMVSVIGTVNSHFFKQIGFVAGEREKALVVVHPWYTLEASLSLECL